MCLINMFIFSAVEIIQANPQMFAEGMNAVPPTAGCHLRRMSEVSIQSTISGVIDSLPLQTINACKCFMYVYKANLTKEVIYKVNGKVFDFNKLRTSTIKVLGVSVWRVHNEKSQTCIYQFDVFCLPFCM